MSAPAPAASLGNTLPFKDQEDYKVRLVLAWQVCNEQQSGIVHNACVKRQCASAGQYFSSPAAPTNSKL